MGRGAWAWCALGALWLAAGCTDRALWRTGEEWTLSPSGVDFGPVAVGGRAERTVELSNVGRAPLSLMEVTPGDARVAVLDVAAGEIVAPGGSRRLRVVFFPESEGALASELRVRTDSAGEASVSLTGMGARVELEVSPGSLDVGSAAVFDRAEGAVRVRNLGSVSAQLGVMLTGPHASAFTVDALPPLLLPGTETQLPVHFRPVSMGLARATLAVTGCAGCPPHEVALSGLGTAGILSVTPGRLDFGRVPVGSSASLKVTLSHSGNVPITVQPPSLQGDPGARFTVGAGTAAFPLQLQPGRTADVVVNFAPTAEGKVTGAWLEVRAQASNTDGRVDIPLSGEGGGGCVLVLPRALDFGVVPQGMTVMRKVNVLNRCSGEISLSDLQVLGATGGFFSVDASAGPVTLAVGAIHPLSLQFTPRNGETQASATLSLKAWEGGAPYALSVPLTASSRIFAPCVAELLPAALDFGGVQVGARTSLSVSVRNAGADDCVLSGFGLVPGSDAAFGITPVDATTLAPGAVQVLQVAFSPLGVGSHAGQAALSVNQAAPGALLVPLSGEGVNGCIRLDPPLLDFGARMLSCGGRSASITASNVCPTPAQLLGATLQGGGSEFSLGAIPQVPFMLAAGRSASFPLLYHPTHGGMAGGTFRLDTGNGPPLTVGITGEALLDTHATELFVQDTRPRVDVLLVVDNSGSMLEEQVNLGANFAALLSAAQAQGVDYQIAVTTTGIVPSPGSWATCPGGAEGGERGRLFPVDGTRPRILTPATPNADAVFRENAAVGVCHWDEQGLEAAYLALSPPLIDHADDLSTPTGPADGNAGFLRSGARLAVVFLSDEEDTSPRPVSFYASFFKGLKGNDPSLVSISAIIATAPLGSCPTASSVGSRYEALAVATGGVVQPICTQDWASALAQLSTAAFGPRQAFPLSGTPADPSGITVKINGQPVTGGWRYDGSSRSVVFDLVAAPSSGDLVEVTYPLGC
jgi:hypothetical protein